MQGDGVMNCRHKGTIVPIIAAFFAMACPSGSTGHRLHSTPPAGLAYSTNPAQYTVGLPIGPNSPTLASGSGAITYTITPFLPSGLSLSTTGVIAGTPTVITPTTVYTVTAQNAAGSTNVALTLTVNDVAPSNLTYSTNPLVLTKGSPTTNDIPSSDGGAVISYAVTPALPAGLSFDTRTGIVSGTPTSLAPARGYAVTATNSGGSTTTTLTLTVNDVPPASLSYPINPAVDTRGQAVTPDVPSVSGGAVTIWSITPPLPAGLTLDPSTGILSGTPTALSFPSSYVVTATNSGGSTTATISVTVNDVPPSALTYAQNPAVFTVNQPIINDTPSSSGGAVISYAISPLLPTGLSFNTATGVVSGTPVVASPQATYTVTATNSGGSTTASLAFTVSDLAPAGLTYATNPAVFTKGRAITSDVPSNTGGAVATYAISPALPAGLSFNTNTGVISGTPTVLSSAETYSVTGTNTGGMTSAALTITVLDVPPSSLSYSSNPVIYVKGRLIANDVPSVNGGPIVTWSITPALPAGLAFNAQNGMISGTPAAVSAAAAYTVTATNSGGSTTTTLTLTVNDVAPAGLSYSANPAVYTLGAPVANNAPSSTGGAVVSYAISPALPSGLTFNTTTGIISGTPTALSPATAYAIAAENSGGLATTTLTITVNNPAPTGLTYSANPAVYTKGLAIAPDLASVNGGGALSWSIAPALPAGLSFNATTGAITGTPTVLSPPTTYAVTAVGTGGTTSTTLSVTVNDLPPAGLAYAMSSAVFTKGQTAANAPSTSSGGAVVSWSVTPTLPAGLSVSPTTGIISGMPTVLSPTTSYTITAANTGGSTTATITITVNDVPPSNLIYGANPVVATRGVPIASDAPANNGGAVVSYAITPALPAGLRIDATSGIISGTPTVLSAATNYQVTATNSGGSTSVTLTLTVNDQAPAALTYGTNPAVYTKGQSITSDVPSSSGGAVLSWSIAPALPAGLRLDPTSGVLSGTPSAIAATAGYVVTATNSGGATTATLTITVNDAPPQALAYSRNPAIYTQGQPIADNIPGHIGGTVISYTVSPALPAGLSLGATSGLISGTPTTVTSATNYVITATNSGGSATATLSITVNAVPPSQLTYAANPAVYTVNQTIADNGPQSNAGVTSYEITPPLPAGMDFNMTTGVISGTPIVLSPATYYTVTASNTGGSTTATISLAVVDVAPTGLAYPTNPVVCTKGLTIAPDAPSTSGGGAVVSYAVSPALPSGLRLDPATGTISGTPTALSAAASYAVTATNTGGATTASITITVNDVPPTGLSYVSNPAVYTVGQGIPNDQPTLTGGGPVTSWSISPALPPGLAFSATTGTVSGTPGQLSAMTSYVVTAGNSGGTTTANLTITVNAVPPSSLAYSANPAVYTWGRPIQNNTPSGTGGAVVSWALSPALPQGLSFSTTTGIISGTPAALSPAASYTVTATNSGGSATATITITVQDVAPSSLAYATNPAVYAKGQAITNDVPSSSGGAVVSYAISPALPAGLNFNASTGVISGTPTALSPAQAYTVTATNSGGSTTVALTVTVNDIPPAGLTYTTNPATYTKGHTITNNLPSSSGGAVVSYSITPALPAGLSLDPTTGIISGTPTVLSMATGYAVTATNSGGMTSAAVTIAVVDVAPTGLTYAANPATYTKGQLIASNTPHATGGGPVVSWSISPSLPAGLSFSTSSGVISGTPTVLAPTGAYTITATNTGGSAMVTLTLAVNDVPPSGLTYGTSSAVYTLGRAIATNDPSVSGGGPVTSWSITPALPGLSFSASTGIISGTPTSLLPPTMYTVRASNSGGSTTATIQITVNDVPPSGLTYAANPLVDTVGQAIAGDSPSTSGGGPVTSWSVNPPLPSGLTLSPTTGIVSGTPTVLTAATSYTVTATNSGGSTTATLIVTVKDVAPSGLSYGTNPATYTLGQTIASNIPSTTGGGPVTSWSIVPAVPAGLSFSTTSGILSGTPSALSSTASYTVTATNSGGTATATLTLTVNDVAPSGLTYGTNPAVYTKGLTVSADAPSTTGGGPVTSWSVTPALPAGLSFSTSTGIVSGTPSALSPATPYLVTATNSGGSTTTTLTLTVNDVAPSSLSYSSPSATYTEGRTITNNIPTSSGGHVVTWTISAALPSGLSFSTTTGVISGTPTSLSPATTYTIRASNTGGSTDTSITIAVVDVPPSGLAYPANPARYTKGVPISNNVPSISGGPIVSWSVSPSLPSGLALDATGTISGEATVLSPAASYTVTATNSGGSATAVLSITVVDVPPSGLSYSANPAVYTIGKTIPTNPPTISGGPVVSWSVTPALPGLTVSASTGVISGAPTTLTTNAVYTMTASNSGGSTQATLTITVLGTSGTGTVLAAGDGHTCAIVNGGAECWGRNESGQLGNNSTASATVPVQVSGLTSGVEAVATGHSHSCALVNGGVQCWGDNDDGELGNNSTTASFVPIAVAGLTSGVQAIATGAWHTCALANGGVQCWGRWVTSTPQTNPVPVPIAGLTSNVQAIAAGDSHTCALVNESVLCWGSNEEGQLGNNSMLASDAPVAVVGLTTGVQAIAAGSSHSCALVNGGVQCWGDNSDGDLGDGSTTQSLVPVAASTLTGGVQFLAAGGHHTCAIVNGAARCWGDNDTGALGDNSTTASFLPVAVANLSSDVQLLATGTKHTCALVNGGIQCWGDNDTGALGNGSTSPSAVPAAVGALPGGVESVAAGGDFACAVVNGGAQCWGHNNLGQLGNESTTSSAVPGQVGSLSHGVQAIATGSDYGCAIVNGGAECWGWNGDGQLGDPASGYVTLPTQVTGLTSGVQSLAAGGGHACAIVNGGLQCWGDNVYGDLGNGSTTKSNAPVAVPGLTSNVASVAAGDAHTCVVANGGVQCWGLNFYGELGNGSNTDSAVPVTVQGLTTGVQAVAAGSNQACALVDGGVFCWGDNEYGQLGNGTTTSSAIPVPVQGLSSGVQAIAAGGGHTCALASGSLLCWGENSSGELGIGSWTNSPVPVLVVASGVQSVSAGASFTCALVDGTALCWGADSHGQLGNGLLANSNAPVSVSPWLP
jgi:uncharacterized repeat protein (TIGR01451 family)